MTGDQLTDGTYRVYCPDCENGREVDSAFIARQLSKQHNLEYAHNSDWRSVEPDTDCPTNQNETEVVGDD